MVKSLLLIGLLCSTNVSGAVVNGVVNGSVSTSINNNLYVLDTIEADNLNVYYDDLRYGYTINTGFYFSGENGIVNASVVKYLKSSDNVNLISGGFPGYVLCNCPFDYKYIDYEGDLIPAWRSDRAIANIATNKEFIYHNIAFYSDYVVEDNTDGYNSLNNYSRGLSKILLETTTLGFYTITCNYCVLSEMDTGSFSTTISTANFYGDGWLYTGLWYAKLFDMNDLFGHTVKPYFNYDDLLYSFTISFTPFKGTSSDLNTILADTYNNGYDTGYRIGLHDGRSEANKFTFSNLFSSIANTPLLYLRALFNFEFFGVKIYTVVLGLVTTLLVIWVVKRFV